LEAVSLLDAAESRAQAAMRLAEEESRRSEELENELNELRAAKQLRQQPAFPPQIVEVTPAEKPLSVSPQNITVRGKQWKIAIPISVVATAIPLVWTLINDWQEMKRQYKEMKDTYAEMQKRTDSLEQRISDVSRSNNDLREVVAKLSGYVAAALPNAGVKVPGAEIGAIPVPIQADPLPRGAKRQTPVVTHTLVPAPKPP
jgi:ATP-dependent Clp protease ATP-binding subunit ClpA